MCIWYCIRLVSSDQLRLVLKVERGLYKSLARFVPQAFQQVYDAREEFFHILNECSKDSHGIGWNFYFNLKYMQIVLIKEVKCSIKLII